MHHESPGRLTCFVNVGLVATCYQRSDWK